MKEMAMKNARKITLATLALTGWFGANVAVAQAPAAPAAPEEMQKMQAAPVLTAPAAPLTDPAAPSAPAANGGSPAGAWYMQAEYLYLRRDGPRRTLSRDINNGTLVTTKDLHFNFEPGFRLGVGYQCAPTWAIEASVFATADWSAHSSYAASSVPFGIFAGSLGSAFSQFGSNAAAVFPFDAAQANFQSYSARLVDLEVNLRHQAVANNNVVLNLLFGVRNVHVKERYSFAAVGTSDGDPASPTQTGEYAVEANNNLFDFQVGGDLSYWLSDSFSISGDAKMGYGWNHTRQRSAINNAFVGFFGVPGSTPFAVTAISEHISGAGSMELGLFGNWRVGYGCCVRAGYQAIFLTNMALAPRQLVFSTATQAQLNVDHNGTIFLHGPSAGVEFNW
jgi:hypothetical protein